MSSQIIEFYATAGVTLNGYINREQAHTYSEKEKQLAKEICEFVKRY